MIGAELIELPEPSRRLLAVAAVAGREVTGELLSEVLGTEVHEVTAGLRPAVERSVLQAGTERGISFRHDLYREILLEQLLGEERAHWHARVADVLGRRPDLALAGLPAAELAHHHERAGNPAAALEAASEAAAGARDRAAIADTGLHLEQVLRLWDAVPQAAALAGRSRSAVAQEVAACHWLLGDPVSAAEYGALALSEVDAALEPDHFAAVSAQQAGYLFSTGKRAEAADLLSRADAATILTAGPGRAHTLATLARVQLLSDDDVSALSTSEEAQRLARATGLSATALHARVTGLSALQALGRVTEGTTGFEAALSEAGHDLPRDPAGVGVAGEVDHPGLVLVRLTHNAAFGMVAHGWPSKALTFTDRGLETITRLHLGDGYRSGLLGQRALAFLERGDSRGARSVLDELPRLPRSRVRVTAVEAEMAHALLVDDLAAAAAHLDRATRFDDELLTPLHRLRVELQLRRGEHEAAARDAERVVERLEQAQMLPFVAALCELGIEGRCAVLLGLHGSDKDVAATQLDGVRRLLAAAERAAERCADRPLPPDTAIRLALARARAAEVLVRSGDGAVARWQEAYDLAGSTELELLRLTAATGLGRNLAAAGDRAAAAEVLLAAEASATAIGARGQRATIVSILRRARLDGGSRDRDGDDPAARIGLTGREVEVLECLVAGLTNREIGERLFISTKTASVHVSNILAKLEVGNRRAAAARARELGVGRSGQAEDQTEAARP